MKEELRRMGGRTTGVKRQIQENRLWEVCKEQNGLHKEKKTRKEECTSEYCCL
jgi:hypothetical protein